MLALLVLHRAKLLASNQSILALGVAPSGVRAAAPHSAPAWMPGVYAQRLCTMQSQQSIHSPSPRGRGFGIRQGCRDRTPKGFAGTQSPQSVLIGIENSHYLIINRLFLQAGRSAYAGHFCVYAIGDISETSKKRCERHHF